MFQEPENYIEDDHFFFQAHQDLEKECNAPRDKEGVFKILELRKGKVRLVYIGCTSSNGLFNEIVDGLHFDKNPRRIGWTYQLLKDKTAAIDIYWFVIPKTENPKAVQVDLLKQFIEEYGRLPNWNK